MVRAVGHGRLPLDQELVARVTGEVRTRVADTSPSRTGAAVLGPGPLASLARAASLPLALTVSVVAVGYLVGERVIHPGLLPMLAVLALAGGMSLPRHSGLVTAQARGILYALDVADEAVALVKAGSTSASARALGPHVRRAARRVRHRARVAALDPGWVGRGRVGRWAMGALVRDTGFLLASSRTLNACGVRGVGDPWGGQRAAAAATSGSVS